MELVSRPGIVGELKLSRGLVDIKYPRGLQRFDILALGRGAKPLLGVLLGVLTPVVPKGVPKPRQNILVLENGTSRTN